MYIQTLCEHGSDKKVSYFDKTGDCKHGTEKFSTANENLYKV